MTSTEIDAPIIASIDFRFFTCTPFRCLLLWYIVLIVELVLLPFSEKVSGFYTLSIFWFSNIYLTVTRGHKRKICHFGTAKMFGE